jgi:hypothetical protein
MRRRSLFFPSRPRGTTPGETAIIANVLRQALEQEVLVLEVSHTLCPLSITKAGWPVLHLSSFVNLSVGLRRYCCNLSEAWYTFVIALKYEQV